LEWKVIYVGKAEDSKSDIVLDEILVGPVPVGMNKFRLQADAPTVGRATTTTTLSCRRLDEDHVLGVTVVLVTCSFREREFVRVGYYVNNEYTGEYADGSGGGEHGGGAPPPPKPLDLNLVTRQILADKPRVTKFPIPWGDNNNNNNANDGTEQGDVMEGERGKDGLMEGNGGVVSPSFSPHEQQQQAAAAAVGGGGGGEIFAAPTVSSE
jgi:histone chaperone ASF1